MTVSSRALHRSKGRECPKSRAEASSIVICGAVAVHRVEALRGAVAVHRAEASSGILRQRLAMGQKMFTGQWLLV